VIWVSVADFGKIPALGAGQGDGFRELLMRILIKL
jgi:hypothetical protein